MKTSSSFSDSLQALLARFFGLGDRFRRKNRLPPLQAEIEGLERFRSLIDQGGDAIFLVRLPAGVIEDVNESACRLVGIERGRLAGTILKAAPPNPVFQGLEEQIGGEVDPAGPPRIFTIELDSSCRRRPVEVTLRFVPFRNAIFAVAVARDISELVQAGQALQNQTSLLQTILNTIPAPIFYKDAKGIYSGCNVAFETFVGRGRDEIIGQTVYGVAPAKLAAIYHEADLDLMRQGGTQTYEAQVVNAEGVAREVVFHKSAFRSETGEVAGLVGALLDITERKRAESEIRQLAHYDPTTELPNRILFQDRLRQALAQAQRHGHQAALLFIDLDRFKEVNDSLGHAGGDQVLRAIGRRLRDGIRESDGVGRLAGDEFAVLLPELTDAEEPLVVARKILELLADPLRFQGQELVIGASIGIALFPEDGDDGETLLKHADLAMYAAKEQGRGACRFFSAEMNRRARERREMELRLRRGLQEGEFFLHYQPQRNCVEDCLIGVEALMRWQCADGTMIPPDRFIPVAEAAGLILPLGAWVLEEACRQGRLWQGQGLPPVRIAVNISGHQFKQPDFIPLLDDILSRTGFDPRLLELELTETILMHDLEATTGILAQLKERGIQLAIDDFGTGYSSLSYLKHFPIDRIKIDRSFVRDLATKPDDAVIVQTMIAMAGHLGLQVIAEGVETVEQVDFLLARQCFEMQGFFFGRPMAPDDLVRTLGSAWFSPLSPQAAPLPSSVRRCQSGCSSGS